MCCISKNLWTKNIFISYSSQFLCVDLIDLKMARPPKEQAKAINYRQIEEHSQTFNEGFFSAILYALK